MWVMISPRGEDVRSTVTRDVVRFRVRGRTGANRGIESSREKFNHETRAGKRNLDAFLIATTLTAIILFQVLHR